MTCAPCDVGAPSCGVAMRGIACGSLLSFVSCSCAGCGVALGQFRAMAQDMRRDSRHLLLRADASVPIRRTVIPRTAPPRSCVAVAQSFLGRSRSTAACLSPPALVAHISSRHDCGAARGDACCVRVALGRMSNCLVLQVLLQLSSLPNRQPMTHRKTRRRFFQVLPECHCGGLAL